MKYFYFLLILMLLSGCGSSGSGGRIYTLSWDVPTEYENGEPLTINDLLEYRIYYSDTQQTITNNYESVDPAFNSYTVSNIDFSRLPSSSTVYVAVSSVSNDGAESLLSEVVTFSP